MEYKFRKIIKFNYKGERYQLFRDNFNKLAFLRIDKDGNYRYPDLNTLFEITSIFAQDNNIMMIKKRESKFCKFTPKVRCAGFLVILSTTFLTGCVSNDYLRYRLENNNNSSSVSQESSTETNTSDLDFEFDFDYSSTSNSNSSSSSSTSSSSSSTSSSSSSTNNDTAYIGSGVPDNLPQEVLDKYINYLAPADDEYDYRFANDFEQYQMVDLITARDSSGYEQIFGYSDATLEEIRETINNNSNISDKYKEFIYQFACDLRTLYPDCNLAVFRHNLETLIIEEGNQNDINIATLSTTAAACYLRNENKICVLEDINLNRDSDDYIILVHELCHAARSAVYDREDGFHINIGFSSDYKMGTYAEEAIVTNIAYELQGLGRRADFYPMQSSYYRIICECIGYDGGDFFNHGVNYLIDEMDNFMGDDDYAYQVVAMIDAQAILRYEPYMNVDFRDFRPVYEYVAEMYFTKYITEGMSYDEACVVFDNFYDNISHYFENMNRPYQVDEDTFRPTFDSYLEEIGISKGLNR
mgnify:CR=1 FL=1